MNLITAMWMKFDEFVHTASSGWAKIAERYRTDDYENAIATMNWFAKVRLFNRQQKCTHLKGGRVRHTTARDYAILDHTFIDGSRRVKCMHCGWEVWNTPEFSFKWAHAERMLKDTTNRGSSSEVIQYQVMRGDLVLETVVHKDLDITKLKAKYPSWDGVVKYRSGSWAPENENVYVLGPDESPWKSNAEGKKK